MPSDFRTVPFSYTRNPGLWGSYTQRAATEIIRGMNIGDSRENPYVGNGRRRQTHDNWALAQIFGNAPMSDVATGQQIANFANGFCHRDACPANNDGGTGHGPCGIPVLDGSSNFLRYSTGASRIPDNEILPGWFPRSASDRRVGVNACRDVAAGGLGEAGGLSQQVGQLAMAVPDLSVLSDADLVPTGFNLFDASQGVKLNIMAKKNLSSSEIYWQAKAQATATIFPYDGSWDQTGTSAVGLQSGTPGIVVYQTPTITPQSGRPYPQVEYFGSDSAKLVDVIGHWWQTANSAKQYGMVMTGAGESTAPIENFLAHNGSCWNMIKAWNPHFIVWGYNVNNATIPDDPETYRTKLRALLDAAYANLPGVGHAVKTTCDRIDLVGVNNRLYLDQYASVAYEEARDHYPDLWAYNERLMAHVFADWRDGSPTLNVANAWSWQYDTSHARPQGAILLSQMFTHSLVNIPAGIPLARRFPATVMGMFVGIGG